MATQSNLSGLPKSADGKRSSAVKKKTLNVHEKSTKRLIEYLLALKGESIDQLLKDAGLRSRGTKVQAYDRIQSGIATGQVTLEQIQDWLNEVEGWGNHQVHFYDVSNVVCDRFSTRPKVAALLAAKNLDHLLDGQPPLWPKIEPEIFGIRCDKRRLRVCWSQERTWKLREESADYPEGDLWFQAYRIQHRRCFHYFELDTVTGEASLIMGKLPSGEKYSELAATLLSDLDPIVTTDSLQIVDLRPAIIHLESSPDVLRRRLNLITNQQTKIEIISGARDHDAYADPSIKTARRNWAGNVAASRGHFFWKITTDSIDRLIGSKLLPRENRFSIEGQCTEQEVRDVLRGMRAIS